MLIRLLLAFILVPLVELYVLLQLAEVTSLGATLLLVIVTGVIGSVLARREGVMAWYRFRSALAEGRMPGREIQDGLMIVFAAALLLTPGLLTDALGFVLLVPIGREGIRRYVLSRYVGRFHVHFGNQPAGQDEPPRTEHLHRHDRDRGDTIDAEAVERNPSA